MKSAEFRVQSVEWRVENLDLIVALLLKEGRVNGVSEGRFLTQNLCYLEWDDLIFDSSRETIHLLSKSGFKSPRDPFHLSIAKQE